MAEPRGGAGEVGRWIGGIFRFFAFLIAALLFFGVIAIILILVFNIGTGGAGEYFGELGLIKLEEDGSRAAGKLGIGDKLRLIVAPESFTDRTVWSDTIPADETGEIPKIEIANIQPNSNYYFPGDEIVVAVGVDADSSNDETSFARFSCELEDYKDVPVVDPEEFELDAIPSVQRTAFFCEFPSGLKGNPKRDKTNVLTAKVVYEYKQGAALRVYFMDDTKLRTYMANRENPLDAWDEPLFNRNTGIITPQADPGPMRIAIKVGSSQPFSEVIPRYPLEVVFSRDLGYTGRFLNFTSFN
ncbi:hypothetical protein HYW75_04660, partial [Candidatus Pacearchaeota archaeon]|nr:hypothetical protein [Candidatus Pacearchaeota archaeon]